jgi:hypothetical protein
MAAASVVATTIVLAAIVVVFAVIVFMIDIDVLAVVVLFTVFVLAATGIVFSRLCLRMWCGSRGRGRSICLFKLIQLFVLHGYSCSRCKYKYPHKWMLS